MYVIKATENAPSKTLKIKSFLLLENVAPAAFQLKNVVGKTRDKKPSTIPFAEKKNNKIKQH